MNISKFKLDDLVKSKFSLPWREGMKRRGINNLARFIDSSPSPQPSPVKGEGVFLTFYDSIKYPNLLNRRYLELCGVEFD